MERFEEIRNLFGIHDNSFGISEEIILRREIYLGKRLPEILRQYYLQLGNNKQINQSQDNLVLPTELEIYDDGFTIIYYENQVVWKAGIKASDFNLDNPTVYFCYDQENWDVEIGNLIYFLTGEAFQQSLFALPFNANANNVGDEKELFIRQYWNKSKIQSYFEDVEFFQNKSNEILALSKNNNKVDIYIASNNEENFVEMKKILKINWDYSNLEDK